MHRFCLIILALVVTQIKSDCLYPEWKKTCEKYCMDNQLHEIQLNQCYSMNPNQLNCKCSGKNLTEKIKNMMENKDSSPPPLITSSTIPTNLTCIPSYPCTIGKTICHDIDSYCTCNNGTWVNVLCPKENICKVQDTVVSCQMTWPYRIPSLASSIPMNFYLFSCLLIFQS